VRPLGLTQQDYDELEKVENPSRPAEPRSPLPPLTWWDKCLSLLAFAIALVLVLFLLVTAQLCRIGNRR
jgi:hypothetical protein